MTLTYINTFLRSIIVGVSASITVGPVAILCIQRTLSKSHRSGIISGLGVATADTFLALLSYIFYSLIQGKIEEYDFMLRICGGVLVIGVGAYIFSRNSAVQIRRNHSGKDTPWRDFASIFGLTITNFIMVIPYILAFLAVFKIPSFDASNIGGVVTAVFVIVGFFIGSSLWWSSVASVVNLFRRRFRPRYLIVINRVAGVLIVLLGVYTILSTFYHLIPNDLF